jgi:hypothetical protein
MADIVDRVVKRVIGGLFAPIGLVQPAVISGPVLGVIVGFLIATALLALPPIRESVTESVFQISCLSAHAKELGKEYCDFSIITFQLLVALSVGGILITDKVANFAETIASSLQAAQEHHLGRRQKKLMRDFYGYYLAMKRSGVDLTVWNAPPKVFGLFHRLNQTALLAGFRLPRFYMEMLVFKFATAFPKGLYGVVALAVFEGVLLSQVAKTYFDYVPACP